ncbi:related to TBP (TATA-binding protein)-interacting protein TIP120 [Rhynchosporium secalis]|uniref:Related to TBP (TATA-binding protein)-interacting protein TIP120 n=1 Tax=Rhynchosporium secalis TaxID=38038 RepID=A0A1E1LW86_RHYSE|nr:related to TBP (TATA-binding protein)-interacting protein TIP120 [Rhynchosporium secalis]
MSSTQVNQNPTSQTVAQLLPKLHDADPDFRFMSLNDLCQVLTIGKPDLLHNDYNTAARAVDGILKTLDDQNGEVQNLAIKCLGPLVTKIPLSILPPLIEKLSNLSTENSVDNSIPAMALRTVVTTLPRPMSGIVPTKEVTESYQAVSRVLIPRLIGRVVVKSSSSKPIKLPAAPAGMLDLESNKDIDPESVDLLIEVVRCYGPMLQEVEVEALQSLLVSILEVEKASSVVKKRTVVAVSIMAIYLTDEGLSSFLSRLIESLRNPHLTLVQRRLYITILGSMARSISSRFGPYLKTLAPFVLSALSQQELDEQKENSAEDGEPDPETDDVREAALIALDGFLSSCGGEMRAYTEETISALLRFLKYDPNYNDDDDEEMGGIQQDEDDMDEFDDDDDFEADAGFDDDDDDASWKVRRCAAKALYTLISTRASGDLLEDGTLYSQVAPVLVQRFNEREENVRLEIISTLGSLIRKTGEGALVSFSADEGADYVGHPPQGRKRRRASSAAFDTKSTLSMSAGLISPTIEPVPVSGPRADLARLSPVLIKATTKLLKGNSIPTKQALIKLLDDVVSVRKGGLSEYFGQIVDPMISAVKTTSGSTSSSNMISSGGVASATSNTLRIAALRLIGDIASTHSSSLLHPYLSKIISGVVSAVNDKYYKISSEAIATVEQLIKALTPPRSKLAQEKPDIQELFEVIVNRVSANDADLEVRQRAIKALGMLLARTTSPEGAVLLSADDRNSALDLLNERLKNETTRLAAVHAIDTVAALTSSKDQLQAKWIREVSLELSAQLRKANRSLRGASLAALKNLVNAPASRNAFDAATTQGLVGALLPLLTSADLHLLGPALLVLSALVADNPQLVATDQLNSGLCDLLTAPLGGAVLEALLTLVTNIGQKGAGQKLMAGLLQNVSVNGDPAVVGKVIGTLLVHGGPSLGVTIDNFLSEAKNINSDDARRCLALAVLGEAGLRLGAKSPLQPSTFTDQFGSTSDKVPLAAAVALGRAGAGSPTVYMPEILKLMASGGNAQYLLLHSIKEILQQAGQNSIDISSQTNAIWGHLLKASQPEDNKAVGAECIGRVAIIDPKTYMPELKTYLGNPAPSVRAMAIQAIRYTLAENDDAFDAVLHSVLIEMLDVMLKDTELENRRLALTTLNSASHNKPELINPNLGALMPRVLHETHINTALIREVSMGPFKHKIDDGLEVRKTAYETLYSLMETAFSRLNIVDFYDRIIAGLQDEHDIRSLCNLMLAKLIVLDPEETANRLDAIATCFRQIFSVKLKDNAVKQELEKQEEAVKSCLRVSLLLHASIPGASSGATVQTNPHQTWRTYWDWIEKDYEFQLKSLRDDGKENLH